MTVIEQRTMERIMAACRQYIDNTTEINWEQRRYEIAKTVLPTMFTHEQDEVSFDLIASDAVRLADELIKQLKQS